MHDANNVAGTERTYKVDNRFIIFLCNTFYYRHCDRLIIASSLLSQGVEVRKAGQPSYPIHLVNGVSNGFEPIAKGFHTGRDATTKFSNHVFPITVPQEHLIEKPLGFVTCHVNHALGVGRNFFIVNGFPFVHITGVEILKTSHVRSKFPGIPRVAASQIG